MQHASELGQLRAVEHGPGAPLQSEKGTDGLSHWPMTLHDYILTTAYILGRATPISQTGTLNLWRGRNLGQG